MRLHQLMLVAAVTALWGCGTLSKKEARFQRDHAVVIETVRSTFNQPYEGLGRWLPPKDQSTPDLNFGGKHFGAQASYRVAYRPASVEGVAPSVDAARLLQYYFARLEASGFTSAVLGFGATTTTDSMEIADKTWANRDRTLFVTGQVVRNKATGEILITTFFSGR